MPVELGVLPEKRHGGCNAKRGLVGLDHLGEPVARLILVGRGSAIGRQRIDGEHQKAFKRQPAGHILDMLGKAPVFMNNNDGGPLCLVLPAGQIAAHLRATGIVVDGLGHEPRIVGRNNSGFCRVALQQRQYRGGCGRRAGEIGQPVEKLAPADAAVGEPIVEIDDALIHGEPLPR